MKKTFITMILLVPCLAVLNESHTFVPNVIGFIYIVFLIFMSKTYVGKKFIKELKKELYIK